MAPLPKRRARPEPESDDRASPPRRRRLAQHSQTIQPRRGGAGQSSAQGARQGARTGTPSEDGGDNDDGSDSGDEGGATQGESNLERMVKKLVRLAISSEYTRQPLKRADISSKVLGSHARMFKEVFARAQKELQRIFGMEMVELPMREKTKLSQRRAAQTSEKATTTSKSYILVTVLPEQFRGPEIIQPYGSKEQAYIGLTTMVVSLIYLNGRSLPENKLDRYLRRMNAERHTPIGATDKLLQTMIRHNYIMKQKDGATDDGSFDYVLGPRAKVEIGPEGVLSMLKTVYGISTPEDVEKKVMRNIGTDIVSGAGEGAPSQRRKVTNAPRQPDDMDEDD